LAVAAGWGFAPASSLAEARRLMEEAATEYRRAGETDDLLAALLRLGQLQLPRNLAAARETFRRAAGEAAALESPARAAEAIRRMAELDFDEAGRGDLPRLNPALHANVPNEQISQAWTILGNLRSGAGDWDGVVAGWREGIAVGRGTR